MQDPRSQSIEEFNQLEGYTHQLQMQKGVAPCDQSLKLFVVQDVGTQLLLKVSFKLNHDRTDHLFCHRL